jgi:hypothetical protein
MEEASTCQGLSEIFHDICRPLEGKVINLARQKGLDEVLHSQAVLAREKIDRITIKLKPLMKSGNSPSQLDQIMQRSGGILKIMRDILYYTGHAWYYESHSQPACFPFHP